MNYKSIFNRSNVIAFFKTLKETNLSTLVYRCQQTVRESMFYPGWFQGHAATAKELEQQTKHVFPYTPLISIVVPTYCTPTTFLHEMIQSVIQQTYDNWELCIADASPSNSTIHSILSSYSQQDSRIKVKFLQTNNGISGNTNYALELATGDYIGLLDHDDLLAPNALYEIVLALNNNPDIDVIYTDEDKIDSTSNSHYYPNYKPDYNEFLLRSCNYICHFFVFRKTLQKQVGLFNSSYDGSQDYDFILRTTRVAKQIYHIPKMLYHWRVHNGSVASNPQQKSYCYDAAKRTLQENLNIRNIRGNVSFSKLIGFYNTSYKLQSTPSALILTFDTDFTTNAATHSYYKIHKVSSFKDIKETLQQSTCDYCIVLNKGITEISFDTITKLISYFENPNVGAVTPKIVTNKKILALGATFTNNQIINCYQAIPIEDVGYYGRAILDQNLPLLSSYAFTCRRSDIEALLQNVTTMEDFSVLLSLALAKQQLAIIGAANTVIKCNQKHEEQPSKELILTNKEELNKVSQLYSIPPY